VVVAKPKPEMIPTMRPSVPAAFTALACLLAESDAFAPTPNSSLQRTTNLNAFLPHEAIDLTQNALTSASNLLSTIDSDIASIPDNEFRKVFAGGGLIMLGSVLSTVFVGYLIDSNNSYADLVAETYAGQDLEEEESFLDSLKLMSPEQRKQSEEMTEMVMAFRERKAKSLGTWTEEDERLKKERLELMKEEKEVGKEEKDMFDDY